MLAKKIPEQIKNRVLERPDAFRKIAQLDDKTLNKLLEGTGRRMSKHSLKYLRNEVIEDITAQRIREYEAKVGVTVTLPVPIEEIVEQVLGLDFDWDVIQEQPGEQILGGLDVANRKILLNEAHSELFESKPGLLRSTIGHEAGHWELDVDRSKASQPLLPGCDLAPCIVNRHASKSDRLIEVLFTRAMTRRPGLPTVQATDRWAGCTRGPKCS